MARTWTTPRTWVAGEVVTAAQMNSHIRDNMQFLYPVIFDNTIAVDAPTIDTGASGIDTTYKHLLIVVYARTDRAIANEAMYIRFNNDSGANYDWQTLNASAAATSASEAFGQTTGVYVGECPGDSASANLFAGYTIYVPHYAGTSNNKSAWSINSFKSGTGSGGLRINMVSSHYRSNSAISRATLRPNTGPNFRAGSRMTIYGLV